MTRRSRKRKSRKNKSTVSRPNASTSAAASTAQPQNHATTAQPQNQKKRKRKYSRKSTNAGGGKAKRMRPNGDASQHQDDADFVKPALEFQWFDNYRPKEESMHLDTMDAEEYLRRVRYEANQMPLVIEMKQQEPEEDSHVGTCSSQEEETTAAAPHSHKAPFSMQWDLYRSILNRNDSLTSQIQNRLQNQQLLQLYIQRFTSYRKMIEAARSNWKDSHAQLHDDMDIPAPNDWQAWKVHILQQEHSPHPDALLAMDYKETMGLTKQLFTWIQNCFTVHNSSDENQKSESESSFHHLFFWIYTLLAHVEDPVSARMLASIAEFTKWLVEQRSKLDPHHKLLNDFHCLISLGTHFFNQGEKDWL